MVQIQVDLSEEENKIVGAYKAVNSLPTKEDAIKSMVRYFEVDIKPKNLKEKEFFK